MTLNTFHLAGHGGANMTLGIPRLREILMTSENNIKTPIMTIPVFSRDYEVVKKLARKFEKYALIDIVKEIDIKRSIYINEKENKKKRIYHIDLYFEDFQMIEDYFKYNKTEIMQIFKLNFIPNFAKTINKYLKLSNKKGDVIANKIKDKLEEEVEEENFELKKRKRSGSEDGNESGEEENTTKREDDDDFYMEINKSNIDTDEDGMINTNTKEFTNEDTNQEENSENVDMLDDESNIDKIDLGKKKEGKERKAKETAEDVLRKKEFIFREVHIYNMEMEITESKSLFSFDISVPFTLKTILLKK